MQNKTSFKIVHDVVNNNTLLYHKFFDITTLVEATAELLKDWRMKNPMDDPFVSIKIFKFDKDHGHNDYLYGGLIQPKPQLILEKTKVVEQRVQTKKVSNNSVITIKTRKNILSTVDELIDEKEINEIKLKVDYKDLKVISSNQVPYKIPNNIYDVLDEINDIGKRESDLIKKFESSTKTITESYQKISRLSSELREIDEWVGYIEGKNPKPKGTERTNKLDSILERYKAVSHKDKNPPTLTTTEISTIMITPSTTDNKEEIIRPDPVIMTSAQILTRKYDNELTSSILEILDYETSRVFREDEEYSEHDDSEGDYYSD